MSLNNVSIGFRLNKSSNDNVLYSADKEYNAQQLNDALSDTTFTQQSMVYVAKSGDDANDGLTPKTAKLTFGAAEAIRPLGGVTFCIDAGQYEEDIVVNGKTGAIIAPYATLFSQSGGVALSVTAVSTIQLYVRFLQLNVNATTLPLILSNAGSGVVTFEASALVSTLPVDNQDGDLSLIVSFLDSQLNVESGALTACNVNIYTGGAATGTGTVQGHLGASFLP